MRSYALVFVAIGLALIMISFLFFFPFIAGIGVTAAGLIMLLHERIQGSRKNQRK